MSPNIRVATATIPINDINPHPANPRRGNVSRIAESLAAHGQYRPIVAQTSTRHILAGNHTWQAARTLGWTHIAVTWLDCDDDTARRVLIADNRAADLADYDNDTLLNLLKSLPTLDGTGFDRYDLEKLEGLFNVGPTEGGAIKTPQARPDIRLGTYDFWITEDAAATLRASSEQGQKAATVRHLRQTLGFPAQEPTSKTKTPKSPINIPAADADLADIDSISPFDRNPRQGDIGAITESLTHLGQYRPIVVNRRTQHILVGNHTWQAAKQLGWKQIAVTWVDVPENDEPRIVLIDNRTSDLATYDDDALLAALTSTTLTGTGFTGDDIDELLSDVAGGRSHRNPAKTSDIGCRVLDWSWKVNRADFDAWDAYDDQYTFIAQRLNLPLDSWTTEAPE